jgi:pantothenate kinase
VTDSDEGVWQALRQTPLFLDQTSQPLEVDHDETLAYFLPLARLALARVLPGHRIIVAVAGPPGSGKSAFATTLTAVINIIAGEPPDPVRAGHAHPFPQKEGEHLSPSREDLSPLLRGEGPGVRSSLVGLDGWHYPNAYLDTHTITRDGETFPLRRIKGAPETYDLAQIGTFLHAAVAPSPSRLPYPVYSRQQHDPIPGGVLEPWQHIVVLEGNYWLLDEPAWRAFWPLFSLRIFLAAEPSTLLAGLRARHLRGGKDPAFVEKHLAAVDLPNIARVLGHAGPADVIVRKADSRHIAGMETTSTSLGKGASTP